METGDTSSEESSPLLRVPDTRLSNCRNETISRGFWYDGCKCWPRFGTVEVVVLLYTLCRAATLPLTDQFIYAKVADSHNVTKSSSDINCTSNASDPEYILQQHIQTESSMWMIYLNLGLMVPSFFVTIIVGGYSDKAGRKYAMLLPCIGAVLNSVVCSLVVHFNLDTRYLIGASILEGCFGGYVMLLMACFSYLSDITTPASRSFRVVLLEAFLGFAIAASQLGLGYVLKWLGFMWSYLILICFSFSDVLFIIFIVKETIIPSNAVPLFSLENFLGTFRLYVRDNHQHRRWKLQITLAICVLVGVVELGRSDTQTYHLIDSPLCWNSVLIGQFGAFSYAITRSGAILITLFFQSRIGDWGLMFIGCISGIGFSVFFAFAATTTVMFLVPLVGIFSTLPIAMVRSFNSKMVESNELGSMFASIAWAELLASIVGGVTFNAIYSATLQWDANFVFLLMAAVLIIPALLILYLIARMEREKYGGVPADKLLGASTVSIN